MLSSEHKGEFSGVARRRIAYIAALLLVSFTLTISHADARDVSIKPRAEDRGPLLLVVSLRKQKLRVFDLDGEIASTRVSSGMPGFDTPTGVFAVLEKKQQHYSNIYAGAPMPFMQRLTWSGIALHAGVVPGYRASHGCIRLPQSFAKSLFGLTRPGVRVVVAQDETQPVPFRHSKLFKPLPERIAPQIASASPDTRLASNDTGSNSETMSEFRSILGFTPAMAAAVAEWRSEPDRPRTRSEAERQAVEKVTSSETALNIAIASRAATTETAKMAVVAAEGASGRLAAARRTVEPDRLALQNAEIALAKAEQSFAATMRTPITLASLDAEDRESDLEDAILDASIALAEARAGIARGELEFAALEAEARAAERARASAAAAIRQGEVELKNAQTKLVEATKDAARRSKPLSVLISLRAERIYVRQGFESVLEAPIRLDEPPRKIGTFVLTAMRYDPNNPDAFDWRLVTAQAPSFTDRDTDRRSRKSSPRDLPPASPGSAAAVLAASLDGLYIPEDIRAMITERVRPGASLIITDRELKENENGLNTEFVVHTR